MPPLPAVAAILADPTASDWLKRTLQSALARDPVDAANDAAVLAEILDARAMSVLARHETRFRAPTPPSR